MEDILFRSGFVDQGRDLEITPDEDPIEYRDWKICTESPNGGMLALTICTPQGDWWSMPTGNNRKLGYYDHEKAIEYAKNTIDKIESVKIFVAMLKQKHH